MAKKKSSFSKLSREERAAKVRKLMAAGHSNVTAAKALGVEPGVVAGIRNRHKIPSKNPATFPPKPTVKKVEPELSKEIVKVEPVPEVIEETKPKKYKLVTDPRLMCKEMIDSWRCSYEKLDDSDYCELHDPLHRHVRK